PADEIDPTKLDRLHSKLDRELVHGAFDYETSAGTGYAAVGPQRRLVGRNSMRLHMKVLDPVRTGQISRRHAGFHERSGQPKRVGASIHENLAFQPEHPTRGFGEQRDVVEMFAGVNGSYEMFTPVLDPAYRVIDLERDRSHRDIFGHQPVLAAEAAADV